MLVLFTTIVCVLGVSMRGAEAASCHLREVDLCLATILISATDGVPATEEEVDKVCEPVQEGFECMSNYSASCFTPLLKEVFDMVTAEPRKHQNLLCTHGSDERARYLKHAPCLQKALSNDYMKPHLEDVMAALEAAVEAPFQQRIPIICCGMQRMFKEIMNLVESHCGKDVLDEGGSIIGMSPASLSDMFCKGYEDGSAKCNGILPPSGTPSKGSDSQVQLIQFMNTAISNWQ